MSDWMGIGKAYQDKKFDELTNDEKKMDFEWKNNILEARSIQQLSTSTFYQDYLFKDISNLKTADDDSYKILLTEYDAENNKIHKIALEDIEDYLDLNDVAISPCLYWNNWRRDALLNYVCAFTLDIDKLRPQDLNRFLDMFDNGELLSPTVICNSGSGVHFYYILNESLPVDSKHHSQNKNIAQTIYDRLYDIIKNDKGYVNAQHHWIGQDYRIVGAKTKLGQTASAWQMKEKFYTIDDLIEYCNVLYDQKKRVASKKMISYAKSIANDLKIEQPNYEDYIETYNFIAFNKDDAYKARDEKKKKREAAAAKRKQKKQSNGSENWYKNTYKRVLVETVSGNRFNSLKALAIIAYKEEITRDVFEKDLNYLVDVWCKKNWQGDEFNVSNVEAIMRLYDNAQKYKDTTHEKLEEWLGWKFYGGEEKRNHRTQVDHLKRARAVQMVDYPNYEWAGRPSAKHIVTQWRKENPKGKKIDCNRDTKLDPKTIRKWWNDI